MCDLCVDERIAAETGLPQLPDAPPPMEITGGDGRRHLMLYRLWRAPTGISVRLCEDTVPVGEGYEFGVLGDHDADVAGLMAAVRAEAEAEIGRCYLGPAPADGTWQLVDEEAAGRVEADLDDSGPVRVVVDGRVLSWEQLGEALASFEGWRFRLLLDDPSVDLRSGTNGTDTAPEGDH